MISFLYISIDWWILKLMKSAKIDELNNIPVLSPTYLLRRQVLKQRKCFGEQCRMDQSVSPVYTVPEEERLWRHLVKTEGLRYVVPSIFWMKVGRQTRPCLSLPSQSVSLDENFNDVLWCSQYLVFFSYYWMGSLQPRST